MDTLLLRWIDDEHAAWRLAGVSGRGSLADAALLTRGRRVLLLVPGETVLLAQTAMPSRKPAEIVRALPYALEEWLLEPPETQHFAWQRTPAGVAAAVVARSTLEHWLAHLGEVGIEPDLLLPDTLALPWTAGRWSLRCESNGPDARVLVRSGLHDGLVCTRANLPLVLAALLERTPEAARPTGLDVWECIDDARDASSAASAGVPARSLDDLAAGLRLPVIRHRSSTSLLDLAVEAALPADFNLLQGSYAPRRAQARRAGPRRAFVVALAVWLASTLLYQGTHAVVLVRQSSALQAALDATYRAAVPGTHRIVAARVQMQQALDAMQHGHVTGGPLSLLAAAAASLTQTRAKIRHLAYRDGHLEIAFASADPAVLQRLPALLAAHGLRAELEPQGDGGTTAPVLRVDAQAP